MGSTVVSSVLLMLLCSFSNAGNSILDNWLMAGRRPYPLACTTSFGMVDLLVAACGVPLSVGRCANSQRFGPTWAIAHVVFAESLLVFTCSCSLLHSAALAPDSGEWSCMLIRLRIESGRAYKEEVEPCP